MENRKPFEWINAESFPFLRRGYLREREQPLERIKVIAEHAEKLLGIEGFADKFYNYMGKGWYSLSSPVWANFGKVRGLPVS
jgi:ribonucleoside-diphosphate reductase alpha chain